MGRIHTNEEAQVDVRDLHIFVTVQLLEEYPSALSLGKLHKEHGYTHEWPSGREPRVTQNGSQTVCRTENFVPLVVPGLSSSCTTVSSSTSPPQDLSVSLDPANVRSNEGVRETVAKEPRETATGKVFPNDWTSRSQKYLHPQRFLMTQIRNILSQCHHGSTFFNSLPKRQKL